MYLFYFTKCIDVIQLNLYLLKKFGKKEELGYKGYPTLINQFCGFVQMIPQAMFGFKERNKLLKTEIGWISTII